MPCHNEPSSATTAGDVFQSAQQLSKIVDFSICTERERESLKEVIITLPVSEVGLQFPFVDESSNRTGMFCRMFDCGPTLRTSTTSHSIW